MDFSPTDSKVLAFSEGEEGEVGEKKREWKEESREGGK